jgi:hypothetical protein
MEPLLNSKSGRRIIITVTIVLAIVFEIVWALEPRNLSFPYSTEAIQAIHAYVANRSEATEMTMREQLDRNVARNIRNYRILLGVMLVADPAAIYFLWNYGGTKPTA